MLPFPDSSPVARLDVLDGKMRGSLELPSGLGEGLEDAGGELEGLGDASGGEGPALAYLWHILGIN